MCIKRHSGISDKKLVIHRAPQKAATKPKACSINSDMCNVII